MTPKDPARQPSARPAGINFPLLFVLAVSAIMLVALLVRLSYWQDARAYALRGDEPDYVLPAQTLAREGKYVDMFIVPGRTWTRVPLTSFVFAGSFLFVPDAAAAAAQGDDAALMEPRYDALNIVQILLSLMIVALIMALAARVFPGRRRTAALISGLIAALYPPLASSPAQNALSETTAITLAFASIYVLSWWAPELSRRAQLGVAALSGLLLGLSALARPVALSFLPFVALWLLWVHRAALPAPRRLNLGEWLRERKWPLASAVLATLACFLAISPWTLYNYRHYGRFLLLDTASINAFWDYHNYRGDNITAQVGALPNPADRMALTLKEGLANILGYPDKTIRSTVYALGYFWHLESNSAVILNSWDMTQRDPDVPDLLHSDAAFLLVGLAGMVGLAGLGFKRPDGRAGRTLLLLNLWLLASILVGLVVPYDARYRLPYAPYVIVLAAGLLVMVDWPRVFSRRAFSDLRAHPRAAAGAAVLCLWVLVGAYSPNVTPLLRSEYQAWRGDLALNSGDVSSAMGRYTLAEQALPRFYWPYRHAADMASGAGKDDEARVLYNKGLSLNSEDPYGLLGLSNLAFRHPEWRLTAQEQASISRDEAAWRGNPWNSFAPTPANTVDVGTGRDTAYIRGFHRPEQAPGGLNYRWSEGRSTLRLPVPPGGPYRSITLRLAAPALGGAGAMPVAVSVAGGAPATFSVSPAWQDYTLPLPRDTGQPGSTIYVQMTGPTRSPAELQPGSTDTRQLGVGLDRVALGK